MSGKPRVPKRSNSNPIPGAEDTLNAAKLLSEAMQPAFVKLAESMTGLATTVYRGVQQYADSRGGITIEEALAEMEAMNEIVTAQTKLSRLQRNHDASQNGNRELVETGAESDSESWRGE